jgi:cytoskeletal protein RodZ
MAEIPVEKKSMSPWAMGLIGLLVLLAIWFVWQYANRDREGMNTTAPVAITDTSTTAPMATTDAPTAPVATTENNPTAPAGMAATDNTPTRAPDSAAAAPQPAAGMAAGDRVTDAATYAATNDKLTLVGRAAALSNVRVVRVVGPKSFTLAAGSEELLVIIDPALSRGVGTKGQIDQGNTLNLKGDFQRIQADEIDTIASNRFRDLTEPEREWLKKTQVYLQATEFSKVN